MLKQKKVSKGVFKVLTGVVVGGAIGSILGLTLAPRKGTETREAIREKSLDLFLQGKNKLREGQKMGIFKRTVIRVLTPKRKTATTVRPPNDADVK